jgi:hypothetical protein
LFTLFLRRNDGKLTIKERKEIKARAGSFKITSVAAALVSKIRPTRRAIAMLGFFGTDLFVFTALTLLAVWLAWNFIDWRLFCCMAFAVSVVWKWYHLVQRAHANKLGSILQNSISAESFPGTLVIV